MPKLEIDRSQWIAAPPEKVFGVLRNLHTWPDWSPWLCAEPDCTVTYGPGGDEYAWEGEIVGSGVMTVTGEDAPRSIDYRLTFLKPWKSESVVRHLITESQNGTRVAWTMKGALPFFMFWMKSTMTALISMDFDRGLTMLKDLIETGSIPSKLEFPGPQPFRGFRFLALRSGCAVAGIGPAMEKDFDRVRTAFEKASIQPAGPPFAMYNKWDLSKGVCEYTIGFPVESAPAELPAGIIAGDLPDCTTYAIRHTGAYRHLGNAWAAGVMRARNKVFKQSRAVHPFEVYETAPGSVPETKTVTTIHFPLR